MRVFTRFNKLILVVLILSAGCTVNRTSRISLEEHYVVMLSMDGFRWDYASRVETPWLDYIASNGVRAEYSKPAFPTKTFPNHYSMATGLYPDHHGIVDNNFTCPIHGVYRLGDRAAVENGVFYGGEPIWVTAEQQQVTAASYFWVGSEAPVKGIQPTYWKQYDGQVPYSNRIDTVLHWLSLPEQQRPRLVTFYFEEPDLTGHNKGPNSKEINLLVAELDSLVGVLITRLSKLPHYNKINLIVTSDHGMIEISPDRYVDISSHTPREWYIRSHGGNPLLHVTPREEMMDSAYNILKKVKHISVWKKDEVPAYLNYGTNERIEQMVILADSAWSLGWGKPRESYYTGGGHGWDNSNSDMWTIFYAMGPAFKKAHQHPPIEVVDLYPLIARILRLKPARVDGKPERVEGMLR
jgi:predicted AlkP superfamily pyrophosphatase or phosphodiesterase